MIASLSCNTLRPKKRKIGMVADLLKPTDAERNAALEAEIVEVHGKNRELEAQNAKLPVCRKNQKSETRLNAVTQEARAHYLGLVNQLRDIVKYQQDTMRLKEDEIRGLCMTLASVRRQCKNADRVVQRLWSELLVREGAVNGLTDGNCDEDEDEDEDE
jgi:hypothetical protein